MNRLDLENYFGVWITSPDATPERVDNANDLCRAVNGLLAEAEANGVTVHLNPVTGSCISGSTFGGFRPQSCPQGAPHSSHKEGAGVDIFDPQGDLDAWLDQFEGENGTNTKLEEHGLYREHPNDTIHWCHLTSRAPHSGRRTFKP